ncbi:CbtA family protein [Pseudonocardia sp. GCM10023141]|uniref:CbtA family protein n=1 Tax=Pseudonocardia sp. GCM10023141 TaxID=3252653 RepID=UPI00360690B8
MVRALVLRGALAGVVGGLLAYVFSLLFAEPVLQAAIDYEGGRDAAKAALEGATEAEAPELFSRAVQGNLGIGVGIVLFGLAVGCFFAVAYCTAYGRTGSIRPRQLTLLVALAGFLSLYLVPFLKYPANPPAIGNGDTISQRAGLYGVMVVASVVFAVLVVWLGQRLQARFGTWNAALLAGLAFVVLIGVVMALLPPLGQLTANVEVSGSLLTETPQPLLDAKGAIVFPGFDADLLYRFRLYSVGAQVILWGAIALVFAPLADRVFARHGSPAQSDMTAV